MARTTKADLAAVTDNLNRRLAARGATSRVAVGRRYDYTAADETDVEGNERRTLVTGTAGEVYAALWHMVRVLDLLPVPDAFPLVARLFRLARLDKARELANWCRDGQPSRSQVRELAEFVLAALTPPSEPAVDWRAEAEFLMQMPLRYAIESYDDPPVRDRLLAQYQKVAYALVAQGGAAFGGDGAEA